MTNTVTVNTNGGSNVPSQQVVEGETAQEPSTTKDGYVITGWTLAGSNTNFDFNTPITGDVTLTANWSILEPIDGNVQNSVDGVHSDYFDVSKNDNVVTVDFNSSTDKFSNGSILGIPIPSQLTTDFLGVLDSLTNNSHYQSVVVSYNGRSVDLMYPCDSNDTNDQTVIARFVGYVATGSWSGTAGLNSITGDFIGKTIQVSINLKDGYASENGNSSETYNLHFN